MGVGVGFQPHRLTRPSQRKKWVTWHDVGRVVGVDLCGGLRRPFWSSMSASLGVGW